MPAPDATVDKRGQSLLGLLFWAGAGIAPLAAILLLIAQSNGMLRIAAVLALLSVALIGVSVALRGDPETVRRDLEEAIFEEIDGLHKDVRADIATAARATHQAFGEKLQRLQAQVEALSEQLSTGNPPPGSGSPSGGTPAHVLRRGTPSRAARNGPQSHPARDGIRESAGSGVRGYEADNGHLGGGQPGGPFGSPAVRGGAATARHPSGGVVRHTETVHVTTRHTIVGSDGGTAPVAGDSGARWQDASAAGGDRHGWSGPGEPAWNDRLGGDTGRAGPARHGAGDPDDAGWSDLRAGERWASARVDEGGRELRAGERRAALRADGAGSQLRVEDRWTALREGGPRSEPRRTGHRWEEGGWRAEPSVEEGDRSSRGGWTADRDAGAGAGTAAALPVSGASARWSQPSQWSEAEREPIGRAGRYRDEAPYGYPPGDVPPRDGVRRTPPADPRWR